MTGMSGKLANARVPGWLAIVSVAVAVLAGAGVGKLYAEKQGVGGAREKRGGGPAGEA